jgi:dihydrolipoamide dehydrogenase
VPERRLHPDQGTLHIAEDLREAKHASSYGVDFGTPKIDLKQVDRWKTGVVNKLTGGVRSLLKSNKVKLIEGHAVFKDKNTVQVGDKTVSAEKIIVATGSEPIEIPGFETNGSTIVNSTGALLVSEVPKRFLAIGGSAIGLEFSDIYHALGAEVTVVELMDEIVPTADRDAAKELRRSFDRRGVKIMTRRKRSARRKPRTGLK